MSADLQVEECYSAMWGGGGGVGVRGQTGDIMGKNNDHAMYLKT